MSGWDFELNREIGARGEWSRIDSAPKTGEFLVVSENGSVSLSRRLRNGFDAGEGYTFSDDCEERLTHWMPLPEPPLRKKQ